MTQTTNYKKRLEEIGLMTIGVLSDEEVLHLLAERKQLQVSQAQYETLQEEQEVARMATQKAEMQGEIDRLNKLITSDKPDDELIHLIEERKTWEAKMEQLGQGVENAHVEKELLETSETVVAPVPQGSAMASNVSATPKQDNAALFSTETSVQGAEEAVADEMRVAIDKDFGAERLRETKFDETSEFSPYLEQMRQASGSIGKILEGLPAKAKRDKLFMLEVAKIDPLYAMHYADANTLKRDPDFNMKVVSIPTRGSGSALAEMLPEERTSQVVMAAIKADYRNVRFVLPQMEGYDDMLARAKNGALQKVKELKNVASPSFLIPKILQKDKDFMRQIEAIIPESEQ